MLREQDIAYDVVEDALAVARAGSDTIMLLNPTAAAVWMALTEEAQSVEELEAVLRSTWPDCTSRLDEIILILLKDWECAGWVKCSADGVWSVRDSNAMALEECELTREQLIGSQSGYNVLSSREVEFTNARIAIEIWQEGRSFSTVEASRLKGFLSGLPTSDGGDCLDTLSFVVADHSLRVVCGGKGVSFPNYQAASSFFIQQAIRVAYPQMQSHTIIHAAAVSRSSGAIILPAVSGSGKTTLTAYLVARNWKYGGDDMIGLGQRAGSEAIELLPFPTALGIKQGSVDILADDYPELASILPISYGAKHVRFTPVDKCRLLPDGEEWRMPKALVFPTYGEDQSCAIIPLAKADALELLFIAGTGIGQGTDLTSFRLLLELVKATPCFRLTYSNLRDAEQMLEELL